uniref:Probable serine/threonine-protein kinase samkC n=1 Tax=Nicotiana tabacum TaxID=4097 RepID=A0A1S3X8T1_TOBAC|nr:PREDICTED: probable serine/threonine-protein kinase samkC [Nicotiana tabacum]
MTNPQDNPGTPPSPSPSNSSIPPSPSTSPKPRLRRVKMLARKTVASGALRKKLNETLKGIQDQNSSSSSDSESYQSAIEGEAPRSSNSEKTQESPSKRDEPVSSTEKTLADLLKEVGASYDPKKRRTLITKAPNVPKPSKKIKASSPTPTTSSLPRDRATRNRVKQSETDPQRALKESKKKKMYKGKGKIAESSKAVEEEEIELVHQERGTSVEVLTPKPKKPKTSFKKSSSVSEAVEPTLAKRTRSVVKNKQSKISEDDD